MSLDATIDIHNQTIYTIWHGCHLSVSSALRSQIKKQMQQLTLQPNSQHITHDGIKLLLWISKRHSITLSGPLQAEPLHGFWHADVPSQWDALGLVDREALAFLNQTLDVRPET